MLKRSGNTKYETKGGRIRIVEGGIKKGRKLRKEGRRRNKGLEIAERGS